MDDMDVILIHASSYYQQTNIIVLANTSLGSSAVHQALGQKGTSDICRTRKKMFP